MNKTIFVTGASGVVGQALLQKAEMTPDTTFVCLVHQRPISGPNIISVPGDITQPKFGWDDRLFHSLAQRVDSIIHSAAITNFTRPVAELWRSNVEGVRHILEFAKAANAPVLFVSTAFVQTRGGYPLNNYEASKQEAERVIKASGVPTVITRPSIILGDSQTGAVAKFQGIHRIMKVLIKGKLPVAPGSPDSYIDYVPQDSVAEAILALVQQGIAEGEYWLTAGEQALRMGEGLRVLVEHAAQITGRTIIKPRIMRSDVFNRLIRPVFLAAASEEQQRTFEEMVDFIKYMNMNETFPSSFACMTREFGITPLPDSRQTLRRSLEYIIAHSNRQHRPVGIDNQQKGIKA